MWLAYKSMFVCTSLLDTVSIFYLTRRNTNQHTHTHTHTLSTKTHELS